MVFLGQLIPSLTRSIHSVYSQSGGSKEIKDRRASQSGGSKEIKDRRATLGNRNNH